jgi:methylated-DNA-[protein]-cysteine S-methyltransferase
MDVCCTVMTPIGLLAFKANQGELVEVDLAPASGRLVENSAYQELSKKVFEQIQAYFTDARYQFDLPIKISGTDFQKSVWQVMLSIPCGKIMSYGEIAKKLGSSPRAVGNACRANPLPVIIPCHRVVSQAGLGGYAGQTSGERLAVKSWLLQHEGVQFN